MVKEQEPRTQFEAPEKAPSAAQAAERAQRIAALPQAVGVTPGRIARALNEYRVGEYREAAAIFEKIESCDAQILSVSEKRARDVSGLDWEISEVARGADDAGTAELAEKQRAVVQDFYDALVASDVRRLDMRGGVSDLIFQLMSAVGYGYACAEIAWEPARLQDGSATYHARTLFTPLSCFEALNRRLAIRTSVASQYGREMEPDAWVVAAYPGHPLMAASALIYMLKQTPLEDWAIAVEKYAMPNLIANTQAAKGSPEWESVVETLRRFGNDYAGLFGSGTTVQLLRGLEGTPPHKELVEHLDRALSVLWRGGDLSTQSRGEGDGTGTTLQSGELSKIQKSDRQFIESVLDARLTRPLLRYVFGEHAPALVYFNFKQDNSAEISSRLEVAERLARIGLKIPAAMLYEDFGIRRPEEGEETVGGAAAAGSGLQGYGLAGAGTYANEADVEALIAEAEARSSRAFAEAREKLEAIEDPEAFRKALAKLKKDFPDFAAEALATEETEAAR